MTMELKQLKEKTLDLWDFSDMERFDGFTMEVS